MALVTDSRRVNGLVAFVVVVLAILAAPTISRATVFTVTNTGDSSTMGSGSLRDAINQANGGTGNSIAFNIAGSPPFVISPASQLPGLIKDESIDGGGNVIIDGSGAGANAIGLWSESNGGNVIKGLTIRSFGGVGVDITSPNNTYGGTTALARDVISGNGGGGIWVTGSGTNGNVIEGDFIGTDATGAISAGNGSFGVKIDNFAQNNTIGGTAAGAGNVISGNLGSGVRISDSGTSNNVIQGNLIGTNSSGGGGLDNTGDGVLILNGASTNTLGGTVPGAGNVISGNGADGVKFTGFGTQSNIDAGNTIGTNAARTASLPNGANAVEWSDQAKLDNVGGGDQNGGQREFINGPVLFTGQGTNFNGVANFTLFGSAAFTNSASNNAIAGGKIDSIFTVEGTEKLSTAPSIALNGLGNRVTQVDFHTGGDPIAGSGAQGTFVGNTLLSNSSSFGWGGSGLPPNGQFFATLEKITCAGQITTATTVNTANAMSDGNGSLNSTVSSPGGPINGVVQIYGPDGSANFARPCATTGGGGGGGGTVPEKPHLVVKKVVQDVATGRTLGDRVHVHAGQLLRYTVTVTNTSPNLSADNVYLVDHTVSLKKLGAAPITVRPGDLGPGCDESFVDSAEGEFLGLVCSLGHVGALATSQPVTYTIMPLQRGTLQNFATAGEHPGGAPTSIKEGFSGFVFATVTVGPPVGPIVLTDPSVAVDAHGRGVLDAECEKSVCLTSLTLTGNTAPGASHRIAVVGAIRSLGTANGSLRRHRKGKLRLRLNKAGLKLLKQKRRLDVILSGTVKTGRHRAHVRAAEVLLLR